MPGSRCDRLRPCSAPITTTRRQPKPIRPAVTLDRQDVDLDAALAPKELARAETLFQARRWTHARASYHQACGRLSPTPIASAWPSGSPAPRLRWGGIARAAMRCGRMLGGPLADEANFHFVTATRGLEVEGRARRARRARSSRNFRTARSPRKCSTTSPPPTSSTIRTTRPMRCFARSSTRYPAGRFAERAAWKAGWWAYRQGQLQRRAAVLRSRRRAVSAIGLSPVVAVLGGPRRAAGRRSRNRHRALAAGRHRLSQLVLRPARGEAPRRRTRGGVDRRRRCSEAAAAAGDDSHRRPHRVAAVGRASIAKR